MNLSGPFTIYFIILFIILMTFCFFLLFSPSSSGDVDDKNT